MDSHFSVKEALARLLGLLRDERLYAVYVFSFFVAVFLVSYLALDDFLLLDDHLFHIRFVGLVAEHGLAAFTDFRSIYFSTIVSDGDHLIYYNFLFYLALWPFSLISPAVIGIKLFGTLATALALTVVAVILRNTGVRYAFLWSVFFLIALAESGLLVRLLSARPFALAPVLIILLLYCLHRRHAFAAFAIAFGYFYWHTATFFLPALVAAGYLVLDRYQHAEKFDWRILIWPLSGTVSAVLVSYLVFPGVLSYLFGITLPVLFDAALPGGTGIAEGVEVYGGNFLALFPALAPLIAPLIVFGAREITLLLGHSESIGTRDGRPTAFRTTLFLGSVALLAASFFSLRFTDYFVYFAILYIALAVSEFSSRIVMPDEYGWRQMKFGIVAVLGLFVMHIGSSIHATDVDAVRTSYLSAQGPSDWMLTHLDPEALVFNTDWDMFSLFYYFTGDQIRFATGLEPRFLYDYDPRLYWLWRNIGDHGVYCETMVCPFSSDTVREGDRIADALLDDFGTDIMVIRTDRSRLVETITQSSRFRLEYREGEEAIFAIYRVLDREPATRIGK